MTANPTAREQLAPVRLRPIHMGAMIRDGRIATGLKNRFHLAPDDWKYHMAVLGGTGGGKSKFLERFCQGLLHSGQGGILIDPHGDAAHNLLAFIAHRYTLGDDLWKRVHYLELGPKAAFAYDPFAHAPRLSRVTTGEYYSWLKAKIDRVVRALLRRVAEADMEVMNRLKRWLKNVLYACGVALDDENTHIGLQHALVFANPAHDDFPAYFKAVQDFLPDEPLADFLKLKETKRAQDQEKWVESTINRLRDILSPLMKAVFGQYAPSIDIPRIIRNRGFIIANLAETPDVSFDEKVVLGGLLIDEVFVAKIAEEGVPEHRRVPFTMIIDESGEFLGEDLQRGLGAVRKYKLSLVLAAQDLSTFAKGELDIAPKVLSMCGTVVCFRQTYRKDKEILVDRQGSLNISFEPHMVERLMQRGYKWMEIPEISISTQRGRQTGHAEQEGSSQSTSETTGRTRGKMNGSSRTVSSSQSGSEMTLHGHSHPESKSKGHGISIAEGKSKSESESELTSLGQALTRSRSISQSYGESESEGQSVTYKVVHLPNLVSEWERDGLEAGTIAEQYERMMQQLHGLRTAEAIISVLRIRGGFPIKVARVPELWVPQEKWLAITGIRQLIRAQHPYNFSPVLVPSSEIQRLDRKRQALRARSSLQKPRTPGPNTFNEE